MKILIVEDNAMFREVVADSLKKMNYEVFAAFDGRHALELLQENPSIDVILSDHDMPRMTGSQLFEELKKRGSKRFFIGMSGGDTSFGDVFLSKGSMNEQLESILLEQERSIYEEKNSDHTT